MFFIVFLLVVALNLLPAFSPPTWMVLSYIGVLYPVNGVLLAFIGALAATVGRLLLAKGSTIIVRNKLLSEKTIQNIDKLSSEMKNRKKLTIGIFLLYAFGPLPSNQLFIAYGLTGLALRLILLPFFVGRFASYTFWILTASKMSNTLLADSVKTGQFFTTYFILGQIVTLSLVYLFAKVDWGKLFSEKKFRLLK